MEYTGEGDPVITNLEGNGDFRSAECIELLKESDIVVTNPPFSIAREFYIPTLIQYNKKFLVIGDLNWITYKNFFSYLQNNTLWLGYNSVKEFRQPDNSIKKFGNKLWFTNLDIQKRHEELILNRKYDPNEYPKYDNYDAIEVSKVADIPLDYDGVMGVPITFMSSYNPDQFEILGRRGDLEWAENECEFYTPPSIELQKKYKALDKTWRVQNTYFVINGIPKSTYGRIFIRKKVK